MNRFVLTAGSLLALLTATGCDGFGDFVDDPLGDFQLQLQLTDVGVSLGDSFVLPVLPGEPRAAEQNIDTGLDIQSVDDLVAITLQTSAFEFTAIPTVPGAPPPSGTVRVFSTIAGYPLPGTPVEIQIVNGAVTSVTPSRLATAQSTLDPARIDAFFASVSPESRPVLAAYQSLSVDQIRAAIAASISDRVVRIAFGTEVESSDPLNPLLGTLTINTLQISGIVTP